MADGPRIWGAFSQAGLQRLQEEARGLDKIMKHFTRLRKTQKAGNKVTNRERRAYIEDIQRQYAARLPIEGLIRDTLLTQGLILPAPVALLQNTRPETVCYMNSVLQAVAALPGFIGAEDWLLNNTIPSEDLGLITVEAFMDLLEVMRQPTPEGAEQADFIQKQAAFYTSMFELTRGRAGGEEFIPLNQNDADTFRLTLFDLLVRLVTSPILRIRTTAFPEGVRMLAPLCGTLGVSLGGGEVQVRGIDSLMEVAAPPISLDEDGAAGGLMKFLWDPDEVKQFQYLPDTLVLRAAIFGFEGKVQDTLPIVEVFDMNTYHGDGWVPTNAGSTRYRLFGLVCHHGETIDAGHYTSIVFKEGQWWHIDDAPPSAKALAGLPANLPSADTEGLENVNPYIFFYVREGKGPYQVNDDGTFVQQAVVGGFLAPPLPNIANVGGAPPPIAGLAPAPLTLAELTSSGIPSATLARFAKAKEQLEKQKGKKWSRKLGRKKGRITRGKRSG